MKLEKLVKNNELRNLKLLKEAKEEQKLIEEEKAAALQQKQDEAEEAAAANAEAERKKEKKIDELQEKNLGSGCRAGENTRGTYEN